MIFTCKTVEERDRAGNLTMSGVEWGEARATLEGAMHDTGIVMLAVGLYFIFMGSGPEKAVMAVLGIVAAIAGPAMVWYVRRHMEATPRSICFFRDGSIRSPLGLVSVARDATWQYSHTQIASIEAERVVSPNPNGENKYTHGVRIILRDGFVGHIAINLEPDQAHMVAVRLSNVLLLVRSSVDTSAGQRRGAVDVLIN
jgi:xanthosine utilization system XapX-like protein